MIRAGPRHERPADGEHLLLPAGEGAGELALPLAEDGEEPVDALQVRLDARGAPAQLDVAPEQQVLPDRHGGEHLAPLGDEASSRATMCSVAPADLRPSKTTSPPRGGDESRHGCSSVVLPAPFAPMMATISPGVDVEGHAAQHRAACRSHVEVADPEHLLPQVDPHHVRVPLHRRGAASAIFSPKESTTTSSQMPMTSDMSCSTSSTVMPRSRMRPMSLARSAVSRMLSPAAGSSSRRSRGRRERAGQLHAALLAVGEARRPATPASPAMPKNSIASSAAAAMRRSSPPAAGRRSIPATKPARLRTWRPTITFSRAVMWGKSFRFWKVRDRPSAAICVGGQPVDAPRRKRTCPASGARKPESRSKSVVLPAPFGPMTPFTAAFSTRKDTPSTARTPPKRLRARRPRAAPSAPPRRGAGGRRRASRRATAGRP